ncbi:Glycine cleavage T-protein family [Dorcoceras hygrometricum]|uniref:Glycine cleavage T-protein family n=1 Tax=Dorcoceras hygrometricum TaxID=472368 RepID=A0A2Z7D5M5_9LAMI|nr:Glycine cleavage T-protein family [Dorcoceras hygrometricum]
MPPSRAQNVPRTGAIPRNEQGSIAHDPMDVTLTPMEKLLTRFQSFKPPTLRGIENAVECESCAWLRPDSQGIWHFKVGGGRSPQSGPRLDARLLRQSALEELTNLPWTESPQQGDRNKSDHGKWRQAARRGGARAAAVRCCGEGGGGGQLGG